MKSVFAFFLLFCFMLLHVNPGYARSGPEDYWNKYVKDQDVPGAIKDMFRRQDQDHAAATSHESFAKNFDTRRFDAVVYHHKNDANKLQKSFARNFDPKKLDAVVYRTHH